MELLTVREALAADADAVARLLSQLGYPTASSDVPERLNRLSGGRSVVLVACRGAEVVGVATAHVIAVLNRPRDVAWLTALVVDETVRGVGVGRRLIEAVEVFARAAGCERLSVTTYEHLTGAQAFYLRVGFEATGRRFGKALAL